MKSLARLTLCIVQREREGVRETHDGHHKLDDSTRFGRVTAANFAHSTRLHDIGPIRFSYDFGCLGCRVQQWQVHFFVANKRQAWDSNPVLVEISQQSMDDADNIISPIHKLATF